MRSYFIKIFISIFSFLLVINILLPMQSDDFGAYFSAQKGFESIKHSYLHWNARIGELLFKGFVGAFNPYVFDFINALIGSVFIIAFFVLVFARLPKSAKDSVAIALVMFLLMFVAPFGADFIWIAGSLNYMWGLLLIIIFLLPYRFFYQSKLAQIRGGAAR